MTLRRSGPPERRTPLTSTTKLSRTGALTRSAPARVSTSREPRPRPSRPAQAAGSAIPRKLADYILERAEGCCDWCGRYCLNGWYSRQHRNPRAMGGRAGANTAANLVLLCGSATSKGCHEKAERSDIPAAREAGFRLRDHENPDTTPILRHGLVRVLPTADGWVPYEEAA